MRNNLDETHDPERISWVKSANGHADFPIQNLPFGIFSTKGETARGGIAIGDRILDLKALAAGNLLTGDAKIAAAAASGETLNPLLALGAAPRRALRRQVSELLAHDAKSGAVAPLLQEAAQCVLHMPATVGDFTDFYAGIHHAMNVGRQFRPDNPLLPNYKYVPIGYHGRASSVRISGSAVRRPSGQRKPADASVPVFGASARLDYELEMGIWVGPGNVLGVPIPIGEADRHIGGLCLLNDWSARDLQAWEYQPLGPFLSKSFLTTISPWIVTAEALAPYRISQPLRPSDDPAPLPYLWDEADQAFGAYALTLQVAISSSLMRQKGLSPYCLSRGPASNMYWTAAQLVAHHTSNGCNLNPGDLLGTGTISAPTDDGYGSLLEISRGGISPIALPSGETRAFLQDGDEVTLSGRLDMEGFVSIGLGPCSGIVAPAL